MMEKYGAEVPPRGPVTPDMKKRGYGN
jgi:hypothetical protein